MANEKRLIDANALLTEYDRVHVGEPGKARKLIEDAPTVDAVEVVHGVWNITNSWDEVVCSACGTVFPTLANDVDRFNYCPNCGAKMDGDGNV